MNRSAPVVPLRGSDASLLQVQLAEMLRRPIGQIALVNVMDLIELAGTDDRPKAIDKQLQAFVVGIRRQIADIPTGRAWEMLLEDLEELDPARVPTAFRTLLVEESQNRADVPARVHRLAEKWSEVTPLGFELGVRHVRIQKAEIQAPRPSETSSAPRGRGEPKAPKAPKAEKAPAVPKPKPVLDTERHGYIVQQCVERLARCASDRGLAETVLVAGVRHTAKDQYPDLTPLEITSILKQLKESNRVRYSAGRWSIPNRF